MPMYTKPMLLTNLVFPDEPLTQTPNANLGPNRQILRSVKTPSMASSGMQFDGPSTTQCHFVTLCLSVDVSILVYPEISPTLHGGI